MRMTPPFSVQLPNPSPTDRTILYLLPPPSVLASRPSFVTLSLTPSPLHVAHHLRLLNPQSHLRREPPLARREHHIQPSSRSLHMANAYLAMLSRLVMSFLYLPSISISISCDLAMTSVVGSEAVVKWVREAPLGPRCVLWIMVYM